MTLSTRTPRYGLLGLLLCVCLCLALPGCNDRAPEGRSGGQGSGAPVPVTVAKAVAKTMPYEIRDIGSVESIATVAVKSRVGGTLQKVHFREGQEVAQGAVLFSIDPRPYEVALKEAEAVLARDRALLERAQADLKRSEQLVGEDFVTKEEFDKVKASAASLEATIKADEAALERAALDLGYATIAAPIAGRTGSLAVDEGNLIKANDDRGMVTINQIRPIYVAFSVPEARLGEIQARAAGGGALRVEARSRQDGGASHAGTLTFIDNTVDRSTGMIALKATFANDDVGLWPGQFVDVVLVLGDQPDAVVVPSESVVRSQQGDSIFIVGTEDTVELRRIKVDRSLGGETVIATGVAPGDLVVTDGQVRLVPGAKVEVKEAPPAPAP